eukprot:m.117506 g.117506  ORF g.117506 m.117506 type:complete len:197 (-) comp14488_c0_seq8:1669-2259(-)
MTLTRPMVATLFAFTRKLKRCCCLPRHIPRQAALRSAWYVSGCISLSTHNPQRVALQALVLVRAHHLDALAACSLVTLAEIHISLGCVADAASALAEAMPRIFADGGWRWTVRAHLVAASCALANSDAAVGLRAVAQAEALCPSALRLRVACLHIKARLLSLSGSAGQNENEVQVKAVLEALRAARNDLARRQAQA